MKTKTTRRTFLTLTACAATIPALAIKARADGHATTHTVRITDFTFEPADLTINAGDSVTFINEDSAPHTATADNGAFNTGTLQRGQSVTLTFSGAASYPYFCEIHPRMRGTLTVS